MAGLELQGIRKRYGDLVAVRDLSFEVRPGEVFGFVGSNGAGKTTTLRIVLGVLAAAWQVLLSTALTLAAIGGLLVLAARIYTNSVLRIGTRVRLAQAWRGAD